MTTADTVSLLQARIRENAARYFPHLAGHGVTVHCTRLRGTSNELYRCELRPATTAARPAEIIVKLAPRPSRIEFDHLTLLHDHRPATSPHLVAPRPLDFFADVNALLTENVGGTMLAGVVLRKLHVLASPTQRASIARLIGLCGQWLANYHRLTRSPDAAPFDRPWLDKLTESVQELARAGFPAAAATAARQMLSRLHDFGTRHVAPSAHRHGDFSLRNVHAGDDWVCVFDVNDRRTECVYEDLSYFIVTLETMNQWPRHPFFHRAAAVAMKAPFLQGYFGDAQRGSPVLLEGHVLKHLLLRCARQRRNVARRTRPLLPVFDVFLLRRFYPERIMRQCGLLDHVLCGSPPRVTVG